MDEGFRPQALDNAPPLRHICAMSNTAKHLPQDDDETAEFIAAVEEGIAAAREGRTVPYEEVRRWLLSWGTDNELPPPKCK